MPSSRRRFLFNSSGLGMALATWPLTAYSTTPATGPESLINLPADITDLTSSQLSSAIRQRQLSCREVMQAYLERISRYNPVYNAIVGMPAQETLTRQAAAADKALDRGEYWGWMHGMPHAVKDLANVRGLVNSRGSPIFANTVSKTDELFVDRIRRQGAIFIGKTNVPEFGLGSHSYNPVYGTTRNAYNTELCAGGSSGGAACAMATHMVPGADGSDMMGSLRNPAAYNNVIGFRPSQGRVPHPGADLFFQQLGYEGPMGRCVEDTIRLLGTMSGYDARAPMSLRDRVAGFRPAARTELKQYKVGWMGDYDGYLSTEPGLLALCERALTQLSLQGTVMEKCTPDRHELDPDKFVYLDGCVRREAEEYEVPTFAENNDAPLIYFSFGSLGVADVDLIKRMIGVLGKAPYRVLVNVGDYLEQYSEAPGNVQLASWYPQPAVIPHCDVVIQHGGNNSLNETLYFGKAPLVMPFVWDGHDNATRMNDTEHGIGMHRYEWSDDELLGNIERLLTDSSIRARLDETSRYMQEQDGRMTAARRIDRLLGSTS